ncbi:hypothetical protein GF324_05715, partial [bacterium]|nr:hypothetical protein [bacterium]
MFHHVRASVEKAPEDKQASRLRTLLPGDLTSPLVQGHRAVFLYSGNGEALPHVVGD